MNDPKLIFSHICDYALISSDGKLSVIGIFKEMIAVKPFLRGAGGKSKLIRYLVDHIPIDYQERYYFEPFLGAGSMFLALLPKQSIISDVNKNLINCYVGIQQKPLLIKSYLIELNKINSKRHYYQIRQQFNNSQLTYKQAARFIYLNKTSYNGLFRVNTKGEYNVPYGYIKKPALPLNGELQRISKALKNVKIRNISYDKSLEEAKKGNFIYVDPPYPPINGTAFFNHYSVDRFNYEEHQKLSEKLTHLNPRP